MRAGQHVDAVDLEKARPIGDLANMRRRDPRRRWTVEPLGCKGNAARIGLRDDHVVMMVAKDSDGQCYPGCPRRATAYPCDPGAAGRKAIAERRERLCRY